MVIKTTIRIMKKFEKIIFIIILLVLVIIVGIDSYLLNDKKEFLVNMSITPINSFELNSTSKIQISKKPKILFDGNVIKYVEQNSKERNFLFYRHNYSFIGNIIIDDIVFKFDKFNPLIFSEFADGDKIYLYASSSVSPVLINYEGLQYNSYLSLQMTTNLKVSEVQLSLLNNKFEIIRQFNYVF